MNTLLGSALAVAAMAISAHAAAQVTFYEREAFEGRSFTTKHPIGNFGSSGFHDRAASADVFGERWEVCDGARFSGQCVILRPGRYPTLASMRLDNRIASVRTVRRDARIDANRNAPAPVAAQLTFFEREGY